jgi:hypothetical protein
VPRPKNPRTKEVVELYETYSINKIVELTGIPFSTVRGILVSEGVQLRKRGSAVNWQLSWKEYEKTIFLYHKVGLDLEGCAKLLDIHPATVQKRLVRAGVKCRPRGTRAKVTI